MQYKHAQNIAIALFLLAFGMLTAKVHRQEDSQNQMRTHIVQLEANQDALSQQIVDLRSHNIALENQVKELGSARVLHSADVPVMKRKLSDLTARTNSVEKRLNYFPTLLKEQDLRFSAFRNATTVSNPV